MVFLKKADFKKALDIFEPSMLPRRFMLEMQEEHGFAYWVSGVLFWLSKASLNSINLRRFFRVQKKIRSVGYTIHEDILGQWPIIAGQMDITYNDLVGVQTDLRHARHIDDKLTDWSEKEVRVCKKAARRFIESREKSLTKWCRAPAQKKLKLRERQLLVAHYVDGG